MQRRNPTNPSEQRFQLGKSPPDLFSGGRIIGQQYEVLILKPWSHRAPGKRICTFRHCRLPVVGWNGTDRLNPFRDGSKQMRSQRSKIRVQDVEFKRVPFEEVPDLIRRDPVELAHLSGGKEVINGGDGGALGAGRFNGHH